MHRDNQLVRYIYTSKRNVWTLYICCTNHEIVCKDIGDGFKSASPWDCNEIIDFASWFQRVPAMFLLGEICTARVPRSLMHRLISEREKFQFLEPEHVTNINFFRLTCMWESYFASFETSSTKNRCVSTNVEF